jgi:hypothetical protein
MRQFPILELVVPSSSRSSRVSLVAVERSIKSRARSDSSRDALDRSIDRRPLQSLASSSSRSSSSSSSSRRRTTASAPGRDDDLPLLYHVYIYVVEHLVRVSNVRYIYLKYPSCTTSRDRPARPGRRGRPSVSIAVSVGSIGVGRSVGRSRRSVGRSSRVASSRACIPLDDARAR